MGEAVRRGSWWEGPRIERCSRDIDRESACRWGERCSRLGRGYSCYWEVCWWAARGQSYCGLDPSEESIVSLKTLTN